MSFESLQKGIGNKIVERRKSKGVMQKFIAEKCGLSVVYLRTIEKGKGNPSIEVLYRICEVLEINMASLWEDGKPKS